MWRAGFAGAVVVVALLAGAGAAVAATYSDTIRGIEYFATSADGRFAGTASGARPGEWMRMSGTRRSA